MSRLGCQRGSTLVELLVASVVGLGVVLAAVQMLQMHAALALRERADLGASSGAAWALRAALRDVNRSGADPEQIGLEALSRATTESMTIQRDLDADGAVTLRSEEVAGVDWTPRDGGKVQRRVGAQSMAIVSGVPEGGLRLRYYDDEGRELGVAGELSATERARARRVGVAVEVVDRVGTTVGRARYEGMASIRVREGRP